MSRMKDAMIGAWEAGAVPASMDDVRAWRAEGHTVPLVWVPATNWQGQTIRLPAVALEVVERLAGSLDDEQARAGLAAALEDCRSYLGITGRCCAACRCTGQRHFFVTSLDGENLCVDCA